MNRYCYVQGNPVSLTDPFGLCPTAEEIAKIRLRRAVHTSLDIIGLVFDEADIFNAIVYAIEGDYVDAAWSLLFTIPAVGSIIGLPFKYAFKLSGNAAEGLAKFTKKNAPELAEGFGKLKRNVGRKLDDAWQWIQKKFEGVVGKDVTYSVGDATFMDSDDTFLRYIRNRTDVDGDTYYDVIAHGTPNGIQITHNGQHIIVDHRTAAKLIQSAEGYNGQNIRLLSCNTGALDDGFAQNLANQLNVKVCAPTNYLWATQEGEYFVAGMTSQRAPDMSNLGIFKVFKPGGNQ